MLKNTQLENLIFIELAPDHLIGSRLRERLTRSLPWAAPSAACHRVEWHFEVSGRGRF